MNKEVKGIINDYSILYDKIKKLQSKTQKILPIGDQITGVIGEYYGKCYMEAKEGGFAKYSRSNASYDLESNDKKVQVKVVSAFSKTRIIAPLNMKVKEGQVNSFNELYLIDLNFNFEPIGFYIYTFKEIETLITKHKSEESNKDRIIGSVMKWHGFGSKKSIGSLIYNFKKENNKVNELRQILGLKLLTNKEIY